MYPSYSSYFLFYVGSMFDNIRSVGAHSPPLDSPFSLISSLTLPNHLLLDLPLFLLPCSCTFITIALLPMYALPFTSHAHTTSTSFLGSKSSKIVVSLFFWKQLFNILFLKLNNNNVDYVLLCMRTRTFVIMFVIYFTIVVCHAKKMVLCF